MSKTLILILLFVFACSISMAQDSPTQKTERENIGLQMPILFTDNMILQHGQPVTIYGTAQAGEALTVSIDGQQYPTTAASNGKWAVTLHPLKAGGPYVLEISTEKQKLTYHNVLAGEVWLCSGQSNMEFSLKQSETARQDIPKAANCNIRLYDMKARWRTDAKEWDTSALDSVNRLLYYQDTKWEICSPETAREFSAIAYYFGKLLQDSLQVPIGLICNAIGGSPTEAWIDPHTLEHRLPAILNNWRQNELIQEWVRGRAILNMKKSTDKSQRHPYEPCYLYETGIRPLEKFPIKGVIWYQGESNAHHYKAHETLFKSLIESWRKNWNTSLPFYFVQLSSLNRTSWPQFRDSQRRLMNEIENVGMAVSSDKGDSLDVHPRQKKEIGERLAAWALNKTYGYTSVIPSGPLYRSIQIKKNVAYITFDYAKGMDTSDKNPLRTFEVAGVDGIFHPAQAVIEKDKIKVWNDKVAKPQTVRYGWQPFTRANLINSSGLPASTFQTD